MPGMWIHSHSLEWVVHTPDEYVKECKHPPEKRSTKEFRAKDADCPYLTKEVNRVVYGHSGQESP
jgi:hypothetical protein